jgi:hypothetical protein
MAANTGGRLEVEGLIDLLAGTALGPPLLRLFPPLVLLAGVALDTDDLPVLLLQLRLDRRVFGRDDEGGSLVLLLAG